jgi:hypothetical protein
MRGSVVLAGALLGAAALVGAPAHAVAEAPDPYSGSIETDCRVSVPAVVRPGAHVVITIRVAANSPTPPTGEVDLAIQAKPGGDTVWTKTVDYNGGTQKVVGPDLPNDRNYTVSQRFRPDDDTFARCHAGVAFFVDAVGGDNDNNNDDDDGTGGLLPDTGGPALLWLLLGVGLVGAGSASVVYGRRRSSPATV